MKRRDGHEGKENSPGRCLPCWQITLSETSRTGPRCLEGLRQGDRLGHYSKEATTVMEDVRLGLDESQETIRERV